MNPLFSRMGRSTTVEVICFVAGGEIAVDRSAVKIRDLIVSYKHGWVMTGTKPARIFQMNRGGAMPLNTKVAYVFSRDTQQNKLAQYDMSTDVVSTVWDAAYHGQLQPSTGLRSAVNPKSLSVIAAVLLLMFALIINFRSSDDPVPVPLEVDGGGVEQERETETDDAAVMEDLAAPGSIPGSVPVELPQPRDVEVAPELEAADSNTSQPP